MASKINKPRGTEATLAPRARRATRVNCMVPVLTKFNITTIDVVCSRICGWWWYVALLLERRLCAKSYIRGDLTGTGGRICPQYLRYTQPHTIRRRSILRKVCLVNYPLFFPTCDGMSERIGDVDSTRPLLYACGCTHEQLD
jgi:hypothetical protein